MTEHTWTECTPQEQAELFAGLESFYARFAEAVAGLQKPEGSCAGCGRCCVGPPFYMTCSDLEFEHVMRSYGTSRLPVVPAVHFEALTRERPDPRRLYRKWACPFYSDVVGCTVHQNRPFACRVFGPLAQAPIWWEYCVYQKNPAIYREPEEIPLWGEFANLIRSYRARWGFALPDRIVFRDHSPEVVENPLEGCAPRMEALRLYTGVEGPPPALGDSE